MTEHFYEFDAAEYLDTPEAIAQFMTDALETGDAGYVAKAVGVVARARGMSHLARATGLSREQLYRSFSEQGNPTLKSFMAVMKALDMDMLARPHLAR